MIPENFEMVYPAAQISEQVKRIGAFVSEWAGKVQKETGKETIAVPVLGGGIFFFSDLVRAVDVSLEIASVRAWGYAPDKNAEQLSEVRVELDQLQFKDRHVLLIDDICDSGKTLATLHEIIKGSGALEVKSAVLIKRMMDVPTFDPDWVGFEYKGSEWFVGYGMDDRGSWRNLPAVYVIR